LRSGYGLVAARKELAMSQRIVRRAGVTVAGLLLVGAAWLVPANFFIRFCAL
jgi:hypothetical protein